MTDERPVITLPSGTLQEWDCWVNEHAILDTDPNRTILAGTGGRPATREELLAFVAESNARIARERDGA
jgi:hypothetical protein